MDLGENLKSKPASWKCFSCNLKAQRCVKGRYIFTFSTLWKNSSHPTSWKLNKTDGWAFTSSVEIGSNLLWRPLLLSCLGGILFWILFAKTSCLKWPLKCFLNHNPVLLISHCFVLFYAKQQVLYQIKTRSQFIIVFGQSLERFFCGFLVKKEPLFW